MDLLRVCLVLTLCLALMTQIVFSAPAISQELETDDFESDMEPELAYFRERRDVDESPEFLNRLRRQVAQMDTGRWRHGSRGHGRRRGRLYGRRLYHDRRTLRTRGRVADW